MTGEVLVPVSLGPLEKFQIVLHLAFDESFYRYGAINSVLREDVLEYLEVLQIGVFGVGVEFDPSHRHIIEDTIKDLAKRSSGTTLLDLGHIELEEVIQPGEKFLP